MWNHLRPIDLDQVIVNKERAVAGVYDRIRFQLATRLRVMQEWVQIRDLLFHLRIIEAVRSQSQA